MSDSLRSLMNEARLLLDKARTTETEFLTVSLMGTPDAQHLKRMISSHEALRTTLYQSLKFIESVNGSAVWTLKMITENMKNEGGS